MKEILSIVSLGVLLFISACTQKLNVHAEVMPAIGDINSMKCKPHGGAPVIYDPCSNNKCLTFVFVWINKQKVNKLCLIVTPLTDVKHTHSYVRECIVQDIK